MAIRPTLFSTYSPRHLDEYCRVVYEKNRDDEIFLDLDLNSIIPGFFSQRESINDLLNAVETYEHASFFKRWLLRLTKPIGVQQKKLEFVCSYFYKNPPESVRPGSVLSRILRRQLGGLSREKPEKTITLIGLGRVQYYVFGEIKNWWQGILLFVRARFMRKKTYTEDREIEEKIEQTKKDVQLLYVEAGSLLRTAYEGGNFNRKDIAHIVRKALNSRKEALRKPFMNSENWLPSLPSADGKAEQFIINRIRKWNEELDILEMAGEEVLVKTEERIKLHEKIRVNLHALEREAKNCVKQMLKVACSEDLKFERLARIRDEMEARGTRWILFSAESLKLQREHGVSRMELKKLFLESLSPIDQNFVEALRKLTKKISVHEPHSYHQRYKSLRQKARDLFKIKDLGLIKARRESVLKDFQDLSKEMGSLKAGLDHDYIRASFTDWCLAMEDIRDSLGFWWKILKTHQYYLKHLEEIELLCDFLGSPPAPGYYIFLSEVHTRVLQNIIVSKESNFYLSTLAHRFESCVSEFNKALNESRKRYLRDHLTSAEVLQEGGVKTPVSSAISIYESLFFRGAHAIYLRRKDSNFLIFYQDLFQRLENFSNQLLANLRDCAENAEETIAWQKEFEALVHSHQIFMEQCKKLILNSTPVQGSKDSIQNLEEFSYLNQEALFELVKKLIQKRLLLSEKSILNEMQQFQTFWLNKFLHSCGLTEQACADFLYIKNQVDKCGDFSFDHLNEIIQTLNDLQSNFRILSAKNMALVLGQVDLFGCALPDSREAEISQSAGDYYYPLKLAELKNQMEKQRKEIEIELQHRFPELSVFVEKYSAWSWSELEDNVLKPQEKSLIFYQKNPGSLLALPLESDLAAWVIQARLDHDASIESLIDEHLKQKCDHYTCEEMIEELIIQRNLQRKQMSENLYQRLSTELPSVQLQGLRFAHKAWNEDLLQDTQEMISAKVTQWYINLKRAENFSSSEQDLFERLLVERADFWSKDRNWESDAATVEKLLNWQRERLINAWEKGLFRTISKKIEKNARKIMQIFLIAYHPDKWTDRAQKEKLHTDNLKLQEKVDALINLTEKPNLIGDWVQERNRGLELSKEERGFQERERKSNATYLSAMAISAALKRQMAELDERLSRLEAAARAKNEKASKPSQENGARARFGFFEAHDTLSAPDPSRSFLTNSDSSAHKAPGDFRK